MTSSILTSNEARQRLDETSHRNAPFQEKAREALELGKQYLGADNAYLARIDAETDHWETAVSSDPQDGQFPEGLELDLQTTYCRRTIESDGPITLHDAPAQGWDDDPAFQTHGLHCYHGSTLYLNSEPYGTLCFVADNPRDEPYESDETLIADLIRQLLERELERQHYQAELTRRTNLVNVLNRVLRHNMRNDMSVIRAQTQRMADQLGNPSYGTTVLDKIDGLIELCDKAREAEEIVDQNHDRTQTNLETLIQSVVADVSAEFPAVSVTVDADPDITAQVLPNFERALYELVENAAKHSGESPSVTVTLEQRSQTVEIRIADTGPGLSDQECKVLKEGVETPLVHGSGLGLWLVHWIVVSHDGTVEATTTGTGTVMSVSVPRLPETDSQEDLADLRQAADQYQAAFEESFDAQLLLDDQARIIEANPQKTSIYGLGRAELRGRSLTEFYPEKFDFDELRTSFEDSGRNREIVTVSGADGKDRQVEHSVTTDVVPGQHLLVARDVTERKEQQNRIQQEKKRFKALFEQYPEPATAVTVENGNLDIQTVNPAFEEVFGYDADELIDESIDDLIVPADKQKEAMEINQLIQDGEVVEREVTRKTRHGEREFQFKNIPIPGDADTDLYGVYENITELKEREQELHEETRQNKRLLEYSSDYMFVVDESMEVSYISPSVERVLGYTPDEVTGVNSLEFTHPDDVEIATEAFAETLERPNEDVTVEFRTRHADGSYRWMEIRARNLLDDPVIEGVLVNARDITQRKEREELFQAFVERSTDIVSILNPDGTYDYQSPSAEPILGYDPEGMIDESAFEYVHPDDRDDVMETFEQAVANPDATPTVQFRFRHADGSWRWLESRGNNQLENPVIEGFVVNSRDITERKEHEQELEGQQAESARLLEWLDHALTTTDTYVWEWDLQSDEIQRHPTTEPLFGIKSGAIGGVHDGWIDYVHPDDRSAVEETISEGIESGEGYQVTCRIETENGSWRWVRDRAEVETEDGEPIRAVGSVTDVTNQIEREQELQEKTRQNERFKTLIDHTSDIIFIINETGNISYINSAVEEILGYPPGELVGQSGFDVIHPEDLERARGEFAKTIEDSEYSGDIEIRANHADGSTVNLEVRASSQLENPNIESVVVVARDVTERTRQEERFQAFLEHSTDIITVLDRDGTYQYQSSSSKRVTGHEPDELIGETSFEYIHPEDRERVIETFSEAVTDPEMTPSVEYRFKQKDGTWLWLKSVGNNQLGNPAIEGFVVNSRDITKRKEREQELQQTQDRMEFALNATDAIVWDWNVETGQTTCYPSEEGLYGTAVETQEDVIDVIHPDDRQQLRDAFEYSLNTGKPKDEEARILSDGEVRWIEIPGKPVNNDGSTRMIGMARDITDRKQKEQKLQRQNERLERFASFVSHDLRNPLSVARESGTRQKEG